MLSQGQDQRRSIQTSIIARPRLLAQLQQEPLPPIVLIVAPAGYGKSTLANQWMESCTALIASVSLTREHNTPDRFLQGLLKAFTVVPEASTTLDTLLTAIARKVRDSPGGLLAIDDYHVIENQEVHQMMSVLISSMPEGLQLLIVSRTMPPLPLARRRMNGEVRELSMEDLSFTVDEVTELVESFPPSHTPVLDIKELASRTHGWIAGIRLAIVNAEAQIRSGTSQNPDLLQLQHLLDEFVIEEVLDSLSAELKEFILCTAFLSYLDPALCDFVLQTDRSSALIAEARKRLAFIRPGNADTPLTYHALFADSANRIAERIHTPSDRHFRNVRAASWFAEHELWEEALEQSIEAKDWDEAFRYVRVVCGSLRERDLGASRLYWLRKLPLERLIEHSDLSRWLTSALMETGHITEANQILKRVLPLWSASEDPQSQAYRHITMAFTSILQGNDGAALRHIYSGLSYQSKENHLERLHLWSALMSQEFYRGNDIVADQAYLQVQHCRQQLPAEQGWMFTQVELQRSNQFALRGDLALAIHSYLGQVDRQPAVFQHAIPNIQARLATLYLEQNDLKAALAMAIEVERGLDAYPQQLWHTEAWLIVARVYHALKDKDSAQEAISRARLIQEQGGGWTLLLKIMATETWLRLDDRRESQLIDSPLGIDVNKPWRTAFTGELDPRLVEIARLVLQGDAQSASEPLQNLINDATDTKRWAEVVQLATWQAVTRLETDDEEGALESLKLALHHGRPGGFVRSFYTPGYNLDSFLRGALSRLEDVNALYVHTLLRLELWSSTTTSISASDGRKSDSFLTRREQGVLELLARGYSNKVIAEQLFITERTAKKHVSNILHKLRSPNRTSAVARGRELDLIPKV